MHWTTFLLIAWAVLSGVPALAGVALVGYVTVARCNKSRGGKTLQIPLRPVSPFSETPLDAHDGPTDSTQAAQKVSQLRCAIDDQPLRATRKAS